MAAHLVTLLLTALAAAYGAWALRDLRLGLASRHWRRTPGKMLKAYVDERPNADRDDVLYSAHVRYVYTVRTRRYESTRLTYRATRGLMFSSAVDLLDGIVQGGEVEVFYDPRDPARAVLIPGVAADNIVRLAVAAALLGLLLWHWLS